MNIADIKRRMAPSLRQLARVMPWVMIAGLVLMAVWRLTQGAHETALYMLLTALFAWLNERLLVQTTKWQRLTDVSLANSLQLMAEIERLRAELADQSSIIE